MGPLYKRLWTDRNNPNIQRCWYPFGVENVLLILCFSCMLLLCFDNISCILIKSRIYLLNGVVREGVFRLHVWLRTSFKYEDDNLHCDAEVELVFWDKVSTCKYALINQKYRLMKNGFHRLAQIFRGLSFVASSEI